MAVVAVSAVLVRQEIKGRLQSINANPAVMAAFDALLSYLSTQGRNPDLQVLTFTAASIDTGADGQVLLSGAGKLYGVFGKRVSDVDTTDSWLNVADDATDNSDAADVVASIRATALGEAAFAIFPAGHPLGTGVVVSATTAPAGTTESAATESFNGFVIVGAA